MGRLEPHRPYYPDELGIDDPDSVIRGIYIAGCVETLNTAITFEKEWAHAHNQDSDVWHGWACIYRVEDVLTPSGKMTGVLAHEIAHLLCPNSGHSAKWKRTVTKMGYGSEISRCGLKPLP